MSKNKIISYGRQWIFQEDFSAIEKVLKSSFLTTGPVATEFEKKLCEYTGAKHAIVCSNGTSALHLACLAIGVSKGDIGVTSANTFLASANCIEYCGGEADFIDIDMDTLCLSPKSLQEYCEKKPAPKVIIPVDFAGTPANLPEIKKIADKYGSYVIEDAAHAIGSSYTYNGKTFMCGSCAHSDLAIFSFHPVKTITTGEGGAVLTNNDQLAERIRSLRSHGVVRQQNLMGNNDGPWYYEMTEIGYNYRITDFQCALGISQLNRIDKFKSRRLEIVERYNEAFKERKELILPEYNEKTSVCPHLYPVQFIEGSNKRFMVYQKLRESNIFCQIHYIPVYWQPYYKDKYGYEKGKCSNAELYYSRCLSLPLYPALSNEELDYIIEKLIEVLK